MGRCYRCGRETHVEYGADGLPYCSACIFYGLNKQCWRCRMYLPASELQQYKGVWACPYCIQDMRDEDKKAAEYKPQKLPVRQVSYSETCERCGRESDYLYLWNGRMLCKKCLEEEQERWELVTGKPGGAPHAVSLRPLREAKKKSFFERMISEVRRVLGIKKQEPVIIVHGPRMPIEYARPMVEKKSRGEKNVPQIEGIIKAKKKKKKGKKKQ